LQLLNSVAKSNQIMHHNCHGKCKVQAS